MEDKKRKAKVQVIISDEQPRVVEKKNDVLETQPTKQKKQKKIEEKITKLTQGPSKVKHLAICLPDSIVSNAQSSELRSYFVSQLARQFSLFKVDEVLVLRDYSYVTKSSAFDAAAYIVRNLQYLETPQYLRKQLFPIHPDLKNVGLMNPIECTHHYKMDEVVNYREGVVVDRPTKDDSCWVEIGLKQQVKIAYPLQPGTRVTVKLTNPNDKNLAGVATSAQEPKDNGIYWGYQTDIVNNITKVYQLVKKREYDFHILINFGDYEIVNNKNFEEKILHQIADKKVFVFFCGYNNVTKMISDDEKAKVQRDYIYKQITYEDFQGVFDQIFSFGSSKYGVRQLRLEEEIFIFLQILRSYYE